ncbi:hypothetical protein C8R43DRAFT_948026 [Mycena crocata]|nr:hypothetical protein C8R43DRAFT_948026 [Mycena crocata]
MVVSIKAETTVTSKAASACVNHNIRQHLALMTPRARTLRPNLPWEATSPPLLAPSSRFSRSISRSGNPMSNFTSRELRTFTPRRKACRLASTGPAYNPQHPLVRQNEMPNQYHPGYIPDYHGPGYGPGPAVSVTQTFGDTQESESPDRQPDRLIRVTIQNAPDVPERSGVISALLFESPTVNHGSHRNGWVTETAGPAS